MAADLKFIAAHYINRNKIPYTPKTLTQDCIELVEFFNIDGCEKYSILLDNNIDINIKYLSFITHG